MQRVKMITAKTVSDDGSSTTYRADNYYLLPDDRAAAFIGEGAAEADGASEEE